MPYPVPGGFTPQPPRNQPGTEYLLSRGIEPNHYGVEWWLKRNRWWWRRREVRKVLQAYALAEQEAKASQAAGGL
jgi:hypothetical protein